MQWFVKVGFDANVFSAVGVRRRWRWNHLLNGLKGQACYRHHGLTEIGKP